MYMREGILGAMVIVFLVKSVQGDILSRVMARSREMFSREIL